MYWITICFLYCTTVLKFGESSGNPCETVKGVSNFAMRSFLGTWYVIKRTSSDDICIRYKFGALGKDRYKITKISIATSPSYKLTKFSGEFTTIDKKYPAVMKIKYPFNIGSGNATIFMTDYNNYGVLFSWRMMPYGDVTHTVAIVSRRRRLPRGEIRKLESALTKIGENKNLTRVRHNGCVNLEKDLSQRSSMIL